MRFERSESGARFLVIGKPDSWLYLRISAPGIPWRRIIVDVVVGLIVSAIVIAIWDPEPERIEVPVNCSETAVNVEKTLDRASRAYEAIRQLRED